MGYEVKLIAGTVLSFEQSDVKTLLEICRIDLSKPGYDTNTGRYLNESRKAATVHYQFFADNGNDRISEDRYGEPLPAVDIDALIAAMQADQDEGGYYRRFSLALAALQDLREWTDPDLRVIQFGY